MHYNVTGGRNGVWYVALEDGTRLELAQPTLTVPEIERHIAAHRLQTEKGLQQRLQLLEEAVTAIKRAP